MGGRHHGADRSRDQKRDDPQLQKAEVVADQFRQGPGAADRVEDVAEPDA